MKTNFSKYQIPPPVVCMYSLFTSQKNTSTETSKIPRYFVVLIERMFKGASLNRKEELINKQGALDYLKGQQKLARTVLTSR